MEPPGGVSPPPPTYRAGALHLSYRGIWTVRRESNPPIQLGRLVPEPIGHAQRFPAGSRAQPWSQRSENRAMRDDGRIEWAKPMRPRFRSLPRNRVPTEPGGQARQGRGGNAPKLIAASGSRTRSLRITNALLRQLSYGSRERHGAAGRIRTSICRGRSPLLVHSSCHGRWNRRPGSNRHPSR